MVDDDLELRNALVDALSATSYEARGYTNGHDALAALQREDFDLLLSDLMMPEMDGITLIKAALQIDPYLVPIIMTGQGTVQTAVDAMKAGTFDYVLKPFRLQTLMPILSRAISTRRFQKEYVQLSETMGIPNATSGSEPAATENLLRRGLETVLVVEDEDIVRGLVREILVEAGYRVLEARQGEEALSLCAAYEQPIQLLLTDVVMPEITGKEVADRLHALRPETRVLFMSGYTVESIVHQGMLDADVEFIQKPFTPDALVKKVREVINSNGKSGTKH